MVVLSLSNTCRCQFILLAILAHEVEAKEDDDDDQKNVAAHVSSESDEISWSIIRQKDLRTFEKQNN